jgi:hypothetical protein
VSLNSNGSAISLNTVNGAQDFTLTAGTGDIDFNGTVGGTTPLGAVTITSAGDVTAHTFNAASLVQTSGTGQTNLAGDVTTSTATGVNITTDNIRLGGITIDTSAGNGAARFNAPTVLGSNDVTVTAGAGNITFEDTLDGGHSLTLNSSGVERFNGAVGFTTALTSITTDAPGTVVFNAGSVRTNGAQTYNDAAVLVSDTSLDGNAITFASTINGTTAGSQSLSIVDAGQTTLSGAIGGTTALNNLTVDTAESLQLPATTLAGNLDLTVGNTSTSGNVTQVGALYVGGTTNIVADGAITLANTSNDFVGRVDTLGTAVTLVDSNNLYLGENEATAGSIIMTAGQSIYNALTLAGYNITSTAASTLRANSGVVGTQAAPVSVNIPSSKIFAYATGQQGNVSIDMSGVTSDDTINLLDTPPGLVIWNGRIINPGQIPGVPQNAWMAAQAVLDQYYRTSNGDIYLNPPATVAQDMNNKLYSTEDNLNAIAYGQYVYKFAPPAQINNGGVKLPAGLDKISLTH